MYSHVVKNDWKNLIADRSVWLALISFVLLLSYAIYNGAKWSRTQADLNGNLVAEQDQLLEQYKARLKGAETKPPLDPADPYAVGTALHYAVLPSSPLAFTSIGQSDLLRANIGVSVLSKQRTAADKQGFESPLSLLAGRFDLAFVIVYLLPLLVLALSFNVLSSERENGTLQMVLSQPVSFVRFGLARLFHRVLIVYVLIGGVSLVGLLLTAESLKSSQFWITALIWLVAVLIYILFWFALALLVNSFGRSSATNAVLLGGGWIALVLVMPSLLNAAITSVYPMPSRVDEINEIRSVNLDMRRDGARLVNEFYQDHPELAPQSDVSDKGFTLAYVTIQQELKRRLAAVEDRFNAQLERQQRVVERAQFLSPAIAMQETLNRLAGTDTSRYQRFRVQARAYADSWDATFLPAIYRNVKLTPADYDRIPRFAFTGPGLAVLAKNVALGLAGILIVTALFFGVSRQRLSKGMLLDQANRSLLGAVRANRARLAKAPIS